MGLEQFYFPFQFLAKVLISVKGCVWSRLWKELWIFLCVFRWFGSLQPVRTYAPAQLVAAVAVVYCSINHALYDGCRKLHHQLVPRVRLAWLGIDAALKC